MAWYNASWLYRKEITLVDAEIIGGAHTDFPVLIKVTDTDLQAARSDGNDFVFTDDDETTELKYELQAWNDGTGALIAWVKVTLPSSGDGTIYLYYGNSGQATPKEDPTNVWDSNFVEVRHMDDSGVEDSTGTRADGTNNGTISAAAQIGLGRDFEEADNDYYDLGTYSPVGTAAAVTVEMWIDPESFTQSAGQVAMMLCKQAAIPATVQDISYSSSCSDADDPGGNGYLNCIIKTGTNDAAGSVGVTGGGQNIVVIGQNYVGFTYDGSNLEWFHRDSGGTSTEALALTGNVRANSWDVLVGTLTVSGSSYLDYNFDGIMCEFRISDIARSDAWLDTTFNNQNAPATFATWGAEETGISIPVVYHHRQRNM